MTTIMTHDSALQLAVRLAALQPGHHLTIGDSSEPGAVTVVRHDGGFVVVDLHGGTGTSTDRLRLVRPADPEDAAMIGIAWGGNPRDWLLIPGWVAITAESGDVVLWDSVAGPDEAHARLIAAAPDLLGALKDMIDIFSRNIDGRPGRDDAAECWDRARDAIAKAEGRTQ